MDRVQNMRQIQKFRSTWDDEECRVSFLGDVFEKQDLIQQKESPAKIIHFSNQMNNLMSAAQAGIL